VAIEIERKFLVSRHAPPPLLGSGNDVVQKLIASDNDGYAVVRHRHGAFLLVIKEGGTGLSRRERTFALDLHLGSSLFALPWPEVRKTRFDIQFAGRAWVVDVFRPPHDGLIIAEVELASEDEVVEVPPWCGQEVTGDYRFYNPALSTTPTS
jgi:adenylate cyclase